MNDKMLLSKEIEYRAKKYMYKIPVNQHPKSVNVMLMILKILITLRHHKTKNKREIPTYVLTVLTIIYIMLRYVC